MAGPLYAVTAPREKVNMHLKWASAYMHCLVFDLYQSQLTLLLPAPCPITITPGYHPRVYTAVDISNIVPFIHPSTPRTTCCPRTPTDTYSSASFPRFLRFSPFIAPHRPR